MTIKNVKRISIKELFSLKRADDGKKHMQSLVEAGHDQIFTITGQVTGFTTKSTQYGESHALLGNFIARNDLTSEIFKSTRAYLPNSFTEEVVSKFQQRGDAESTIEFTAHVHVMEDSGSATGYSYDVRPVRTAENMAWEAQAMQSLTALPAPEKTKKLKKSA